MPMVPLSKPSDQDDAPRQKGQQRPPEERYGLRVDGQFKGSLKANETALTAGQAIKKAYPVVIVTVMDVKTAANEGWPPR